MRSTRELVARQIVLEVMWLMLPTIPVNLLKVLEWKTQGERPHKIFTAKYNSHMSNTSETQDSGTSGNKHNLNPGCYKSLSKIHIIIVGMKW